MHSVVAATSDTIRVWGLDSQRAAVAEHDCVADTAVDVIKSIASVSWAASAASFVVAGKGTAIRQYGWTGEALQDIKPSRGVAPGSLAHVVAVQHYGEGSNALFVADNTTRQVHRWDFVRRDYTAVCQAHDSVISCMAVCPKKRLVATATAHGGEIALFNLLHNTRSDLRSATHKALTCISIAPVHRSLVAVGSEDGLVQLFDATRSAPTPQRTLAHVHSAPLRGVAFHPLSHSTIITSGLDRRVVITDTSAPSGGTRARGALEISAKAPLTCLSCSQDPCIIGVGTIDGDVLTYDSRMPATPLWHASVKPGHAVVSMDIVQRTSTGPVSSSRPLKRAASLQEGKEARPRHGLTGGRDSSDEGTAVGQQQERRRAGMGAATARLVEGRAGAHAIPPTSASGRGESGLRPPQHPTISRFRAAVSEQRSKVTVGVHKPASTLPPQPTRSGGDAAVATSMDDMSMLAKDRSYMDLLSPTKPDPGPGAFNPAPLGHRWSGMLASLTNNKLAGSLVGDTSPPREQRHSPWAAANGPGTTNSASFGPVSPVPQPWPPRAARPERRPAHDAGDSMMEMFTPEKPLRPSAQARGAGSAAAVAAPVEQAPRNDSCPRGAAPPRDNAKTLVSRLLDQRGLKSAQPAAPADNSGAVARTEAAPPSALRTTTIPPAVPLDTPPQEKQASVARSIERHPPRRARPQATPALAVMAAEPVEPAAAGAAAVAAGLGALSSSVLQNAVADALAPLCEQLRGEIRNLHLDMIRQGFAHQEQIKALRRECGEAQALRAELEQLRRENAQLQRHMPFFHLPANGTGGDGGPA
ncbi:hypothetical protein H4R19_000046 [Coemansia spiralis]|nr:hypothetical protein H4R19_000046 [Coemansia spiralis]